MTPAEQASRLVVEMEVNIAPFATLYTAHETAKACALKAVDYIINSDPTEPCVSVWYETAYDRVEEVIEYWHEVKNEIEKL